MTKTKQVAVRVEHLTKTFKIPLERSSGIKQKIVNFFRGKKGYREFTPLNDISFEIEQGEFFGIVGRNGSGKSTLLKSIAGIYTPTSGNVHVQGKLVPFIELGVGFNAELTGRENVYLNGAMLGFSNEEVDAMYEEIVNFAELGDFMEESLKNYSSGMQVRLAFSIAIRAKGDILLLDEVLAVGDSAFQKKCYDYFNRLKDENRTVVLVTHSMSNIEEFCDRAMLIDKGEIKVIGDKNKVSEEYEKLFFDQISHNSKSTAETVTDEGLIDCKISVTQGIKTGNLRAYENLSIDIQLTAKTELNNINPVVNIKNFDSNVVCAFDIKQLQGNYINLKKGQVRTYRIEVENIFTDGPYTVNLGVDRVDGLKKELIYKKSAVAEFSISGIRHHKASLAHPRLTMEQ